MTQSRLTHLDMAGHARMVDISAKPVTHRKAVACGEILMASRTLDMIQSGDMPKGDVYATARIAGIMAAKKTADLIPLCHPLSLSSISVDFAAGNDKVVITAVVTTTGATGVEIEALTAVSVAALTLYDMCKAVDRGMQIDNIRLLHKSGGQSGKYNAK
jgi:cyclic pyranopterin phosphate synthase